MAVRAVVWSVVLSSTAAVAFAGWMVALPRSVSPPGEDSLVELVLLGTILVSWAVTGAELASLRPRNPLGWLFLGLGASGACQSGLAASGLATGQTTTVAMLLDRTREEVTTAVGEIRRIIDGLRPTALDRFGLAEATRRHAQALAPALTVEVCVSELPSLPSAVESAAYRIITEAMTNVARHAAAQHVSVALTATGHTLLITVTDDGRGFPAQESTGVGVASMHRRAHALGGSFTIVPVDRGTIVTATLPLEGP